MKESGQNFWGRIGQAWREEINNSGLWRYLWFVVLLSLTGKSMYVLASMYSGSQGVLMYGLFSVVPLFVLLSVAFLFTPKNEVRYLFVLDVFLSILLLVDVVYARAYGHPIGLHMLLADEVMTDLTPSALSLVRPIDFLLLADLPVFFFQLFRNKPLRRIKKRMGMFVVMAILGVSLSVFWFQQLEDSHLLGNYQLHTLLMSPVGHHFYDLYRFSYERGMVLEDGQRQEIEAWLEHNGKFLAPSEEFASLQGLLAGKNLIVIQFESLENFVLEKTIQGVEVTPNLNRMLEESLYFSHVCAQVRDGNSADAEFMYHTSLYPLSSGSAFIRFPQNHYVTLPLLLRDKGYATLAIHGDDKRFWNRDVVFPHLGYEDYIHEERFVDQRKVGMGMLDEALFLQAGLALETLKEPYHLFLITLTSHMPFHLDGLGESVPLLDVSEIKRSTDQRYLQSIHYADWALGEFLDQLVEDRKIDNTAIIVYGDHEGVHKYYESDLPDNEHKVPFLVYLPGLQGREIQKQGGQIDMMPTLAFLLGLQKEQYAPYVMGRNLLGPYSGSAMTSLGEILPKTDEPEHLRKAIRLADLYIRGDYAYEEMSLPKAK